MKAATTKSRLFIFVVLLAVLSSVRVIHAQDYSPDCTAEIPQWVRDRQQYETTYVHVPPVVEAQPVMSAVHIPQWVIDRQQYETTYVYVPPAAGLAFQDARCSVVQALNS